MGAPSPLQSDRKASKSGANDGVALYGRVRQRHVPSIKMLLKCAAPIAPRAAHQTCVDRCGQASRGDERQSERFVESRMLRSRKNQGVFAKPMEAIAQGAVSDTTPCGTKLNPASRKLPRPDAYSSRAQTLLQIVDAQKKTGARRPGFESLASLPQTKLADPIPPPTWANSAKLNSMTCSSALTS